MIQFGMTTKEIIKLSESYAWNMVSKILVKDSQEIKFSLRQQKTLELLVDNLDKEVSNSDIFNHIFEDNLDKYNEKSVRNIISNIKKHAPNIPIHNMYGGRYVLKKYKPDISLFTEHIPVILNQVQNIIIVTDPNQKDNPIIYVNSAFYDLYGYEEHEVYGRNCRFLQLNDQEQDATIEITNAINNGESIETNIRNYTKDGDKKIINVHISPICDKQNGKVKYFFRVQKDITELYEKEQALLNEKNKAQQYLDMAGNLIIALDVYGVITLVNQKGAEILEADKSEIIGKNWFDHFLEVEDLEMVKGFFVKFMNGKVKEVEYVKNKIISATGKIKHIAWHNTLILEENKIVGILSSGVDISSQGL